jgi:hypothetical protein
MTTSLKLFGEEDITNYLLVIGRRIVNSWNNSLMEYGTNIIGGVGLAVFFIHYVSNVLVFDLVNLQVKYFALRFR